MNFFERKLRRTAPTGGDSRNVLVIPPLHARVNGWSLPLHGFQVIGWLVYGYMAAVGFGIYIPLLPPPWNHAAYCVIGTAFFFHFVTHLAAVSIDPADSSVRARKNYSNPMPVLDKRKHPHVIHNLHCYLCEVDVGSKVKHCSNCNKCISDFDHHCKWLNNCVGGRNYWFFFVTVASAVLGVLLLAFVILFIFIEHFVNPQNLRTAAQFYSVRGNGTWLVFLPLAPLETNSAGILVPAFITVMLCVVSFLLLCHLLGFHIYLLTKNMSTYEYMVRQRRTRSSGEPAATSVTNPSLQNLPPVEMSIDCDAPLSGRVSALKYHDKGPLNSRFSGAFCAEMDSFKQAAGDPEVAIQYGSKSSSQTLPGEVVVEDSLNWRLGRMDKPPGLEESGAGLVEESGAGLVEESGAGLVEESGAGLVEGVPVVQNPLGSSIMTSTAVHQQLFTGRGGRSWRPVPSPEGQEGPCLSRNSYSS